jgi:heme exporter protein A
MRIELEARQLACVRGRRRLFSDVNIGLSAGCALRVAGANGSGKSTLLRMLCGLVSPESGSVQWRGADIRSARGQLLYLGHEPAIKDDLSAVENLVAAAALEGSPVSMAEARGALAGLIGVGEHACRLLSEGQRKRVALARLHLGRDKRLWVLDEPFSALDAPAVKALTATLDAHLADGGMLVYTTHQDIALRSRETLTLGLAC